MKRSEMLAKIHKAINSTICIENRQLVFDTEKIAEKVLKTVEKHMLPPLVVSEHNQQDELVFKWEEEEMKYVFVK